MAVKDISQFNKAARLTGGLRYDCRQCQLVAKRKYDTEKKDQMNAATYEARQRDLNSALKKVLNATPITEPWLGTAISAQMRRSGTGGGDTRATMGCLDSLVEMGLVREVTKGYFKRVEVKDRQVLVEPVIVTQTPFKESVMHPVSVVKSITPAPTSAAASTSPIDRLSKLANRLRDLATDMDTAALELAEQAERNEVETAKMRQLQVLLKSLG